MSNVIALGRYLTPEQREYAILRASSPDDATIANMIAQCEDDIRNARNVQDAIARIHAIEVYCEDAPIVDRASRVVALYLAQKN